MSMSTQHGGGNRRPSATKPGGKPGDKTAAEAAPDTKSAAKTGSGSAKSGSGSTATRSGGAKAAGAKTAGKGAGARPAAGRPTAAGKSAAPAAAGKGGGRRPITPVKVNQGRNWVPILMVVAVIVFAAGIVGYMGWQVYQNGRSWEDKANSISGIVDYKKTDKSLSQAGQHAWGPLTYKQSPPVGGKHNFNWQNCMGDVYDAQIASEHAVHSMEHGAVWVTYNPSKLSKAQVDQLAKKVRGKEYMLMSPYPSLDKPISLQAWGYQLKLDSVDDGRIDQFVSALRKNAGIEQGAVCSGGITETGTTPHDLGKDQPQQPGGQQQMPGVQPTG